MLNWASHCAISTFKVFFISINSSQWIIRPSIRHSTIHNRIQWCIDYNKLWLKTREFLFFFFSFFFLFSEFIIGVTPRSSWQSILTNNNNSNIITVLLDLTYYSQWINCKISFLFLVPFSHFQSNIGWVRGEVDPGAKVFTSNPGPCSIPPYQLTTTVAWSSPGGGGMVTDSLGLGTDCGIYRPPILGFWPLLICHLSVTTPPPPIFAILVNRPPPPPPPNGKV